VTIGATCDLTGPTAAPVKSQLGGFNAWFSQVNAGGGVGGRKIDFKVLNDGYDATRAVANTRQLVSEGAFAMTACGTIEAAAIQPVLEKAQVPLLFPYAGVASLVQPVSKYIYSILPLYGDQITRLIDFAFAKYGSGSVAMLAQDLPGVTEYEAAAKNATTGGGGKWLGSQVVKADTADYTPFVLSLKSRNPDYVFLVQGAPQAAKALNTMLQQGALPAKYALGITPESTGVFLSAANPQAASKMLAVSTTVAPDSVEASSCREAILKYQPSITPDGFSMFGCTAAQLMVAAIEKTGAKPTVSGLLGVLDGLNQFQPSPALSKVSFSVNQHMGIKSMYVLSPKDGKFVTVGETKE